MPPELSATLRLQEGAVSRAQAFAAWGPSPVRSLLASGRWQRVTDGIFAATSEVGVRQRLWAGYLLGGDGSALGGDAALVAGGMPRLLGDVDVWLPQPTRRRDRPGWEFRRDGLGRLDHTSGTLPRIRLEEALLDVGQHLDLVGWVALASDALREGKVSLERLRDAAGRRPRLSHRRMVTDILADLAGVESTLEWAYLRDVEKAHGLPTGRRQRSLTVGTRSDVHYDEHATVVEVDGRHHARSETSFRDLDRDNAHTALGTWTLRYGSADVRGRPCAVARQVATALSLHGWSGPLTPCRRCAGACERSCRGERDSLETSGE